MELGDPIGQGRFGTVHRGNWHGDVAIRLLNMDQIGDEKVLESFKLEVGIRQFLKLASRIFANDEAFSIYKFRWQLFERLVTKIWSYLWAHA